VTLSPTLVEPAFFTHPDYYDTHGPEVGELLTVAGFAPDPEQQMLLDVIFAVDRQGLPVADEVVVVAPRQNIKTGLFKQCAVGKVFYLERPLFVWSAHEFSTTQEAFRDLQTLIENCPTLDRQVKHIHQASGSEAIELLGGQRIKFKARTKSGGRGLTGDDVLLDEGFALQPTHMGALQPTMAARPSSQMFVGSSAGGSESAVLRSMRDRGRKGEARLIYVEWSTPEDCRPGCSHEVGTRGCVLDDMTKLAQANPQLGRRIKPHKIESFRLSMPPLEFGREFAGWWDEPGLEAAALPFQDWVRLEDEDAEAWRVAAFGVEVSLDRASAAIGMAGPSCTCVPPLARCPDGVVFVESVERGRGTDWVVPRCVELNAADPAPFVVDSGGPAATLVGELEAAGLTVIVTSTTDIGVACAGFVDAVAQSTLSHGPQQDLDVAVRGARKRPLGDGRFAFGRKASDVDISPLVAVTLAHWAAVNRPPVNILNSVW